MNKSVILLCKNYKCFSFDKSDCKKSQISLARVGGEIDDRLICEDFEEKSDKDDEVE